jgi:hypothetical protein
MIKIPLSQAPFPPQRLNREQRKIMQKDQNYDRALGLSELYDPYNYESSERSSEMDKEINREAKKEEALKNLY